MDFALLPPEINSGRMWVGPGSGPMLAAAAAWDELAVELQSTVESCSATIETLCAGPWTGPSAAAMTAAVAPYLTWVGSAAAQAKQTATQANAAAAAYEAAFTATVPPAAVAANRAQWTALVATNLFGQNTPAIAATEALYAEMWAQDAMAMYGYAEASASATTLTPFIPPPLTTNPGGVGGQASAFAHAAATSAVTKTQAELSQLTSAVPKALQELASPVSSRSASWLTKTPYQVLYNLGLISPSTILEPAGLTTASGAWADAAQGDEEIADTQKQTKNELLEEQRALTNKMTGVEEHLISRLGQLPTAGSTGAASVGQAASVGSLSIPPAWTTTAPTIRLATVALPASPVTSLGAAPEAFTAGPASFYSQMMLASMAGRVIGGAASPGHRERIRVNTPVPMRPPSSAQGRAAGIAEMSELADVLSKLGALQDSGILTSREFNEQKRRLLGETQMPV